MPCLWPFGMHFCHAEPPQCGANTRTSYLCLPVNLSLPLHLPSAPQSLAAFGLLSTSRTAACEGWIVNNASFALKHRRDSFYLETKTNKYKYICITYLVRITGAHSSAPGDIL